MKREGGIVSQRQIEVYFQRGRCWTGGKKANPPQNKKTKKQAQQISTVEEGGKNIIHKEISI